MNIKQKIMHKFHLSIFSVFMACFVFAQSAWAFSSSKYATTSKLASGKWVKVKVTESGVYEITAQELAEMGFSDPASVRVYGSGGTVINEVLNGKANDDLVAVPVSRYGDKICFYGRGVVNFTLSDPRTDAPHYARTINPYSQVGYYFLTEGTGNDEVTKAATSTVQGTEGHSSSLDRYYSENEETSAGFTGKDLLGRRITDNDNAFEFSLPGLVENTPISVSPCVAARIEVASSGSYSTVGYVQSYLKFGEVIDTLNFTLSASAITYCETSLNFYDYANPTSTVVPTNFSENGKLLIGFNIPTDLTLKWSRMDYFILTYQHQNKIVSNGQFQMGYNQMTTDYRIELPDAANDLVVWNIDNDASPVEYTYSDYVTESGETVKAFSPQLSSSWAQFVAFSPSQTLLKISGFENVENQNIHGESTPDMVIVTNKTFIDQAERVAQMHRNNDGMDVLVVDQEKVFNEFSSGTPDAMGIRLMNKMFYDRDNTKLKYLLMFGCGTFDNRGITSSKQNTVITYQSTNSYDENNSYVSDDFFGVLGDNTGNNISNEALTLGVGRITAATESEAKTDVDKLIEYVNDPDYGVWRNNILTSSDEGDSNKHLFQATGMHDLLTTDLSTGMIADKAYVDLFPNASTTSEPGVSSDRLTATEANRHIKEALTTGQYYWTYIGHAGPMNYTKYRHMWTVSNAKNVEYEHLPIFVAACCDVARYDSDTRGIAEYQFHKRNGGAIAIFTSPRSVYSDNNDKLNRAWASAMFSYSSTGEMSRLGDIYKTAKQVFGTSTVPDKVKFFLLGDPAMKVNYPKPYFKITSVNGTAVDASTTVSIKPLQQLTITAQVMNESGEGINTNFTGDAYVTLYDQERTYKTITGTYNNKSTTRTVTYPRTQLAQVAGRVENGVFTATLTVPRYVEAINTNGLIAVYAHQDNTTEMVNGQYANLTIGTYDSTACVVDTEAPVIESMFFNDDNEFAQNAYIASSATLYINATDNVALCNKAVGLGSAMTLVLDGGSSSYEEVKSHAVITNDGKQLAISFPMSGLSIGRHTLTYTVSDAAGNQSSRTISFIVGPASEVTLTAEETPAIDKATFDIETELTETPNMTIKVTDATGKLVWTKTANTFPVVWDLKDANGNKVAPGLYRYFGTYQTTNEYGGTDISRLIVIDGYKTSK